MKLNKLVHFILPCDSSFLAILIAEYSQIDLDTGERFPKLLHIFIVLNSFLR